MQTNSRRFVRALLCLFGFAALLVAASSGANAQIFQYLYGNSSCRDMGHGGVQPVSTGGYISVGFTSGANGCGSTDVYVVRTNNLGALTWSRAINICVNDTATDVRECANGDFIITGGTDTNTLCQRRHDAFLMRMAPNGTIRWIRTYGTTSDESAFCVIEATKSAGGSTKAGDFVVAGWRKRLLSSNGATRDEGYLFRTTSNGMLLWDASYSVPTTQVTKWAGLFSLDEATYNQDGNGKGVGDIVACGVVQQVGGPTGISADAFMIRVSGNGGGFTGVTHGALIWNADSNEIGRTVRELKTGTQAGNLVMVGGRYTGTATPHDIFAVKTGPNPNGGAIADRLYHASQCVGDEAIWMREILSTNAGLTTGNMIIAGNDLTTGTNNTITTGALLMEIVPGNLAMAPGPANLGFKRYIANTWSNGYSVAEVPSSLPNRSPGFILCGSSDSGADGSQMYLVKTNATGVSCWSFNVPDIWDSVPGIAGVGASPDVVTVGSACRPDSVLRNVTYQTQLCSVPISMCTICKQSTQVAAPDASAGALASAPNPVRRGSMITLTYDLAQSGQVTVMVADATGQVIERSVTELEAGSVELPLSTDTWPAGTYLITLTAGGSSTTRQVIVLE